MSKHAAGKFSGHLVERGGSEIIGGDERKNGRPGIGGAVHVSDMNLVEWSFTNTEHQGTAFFKTHVGGALNQVRGNALGDAGQCADAAGQHDHGIGRVGATGDVGSDIGVRLQMDFARGAVSAQQLAEQVTAAVQLKFFRHHPQGSIGSDEVDVLYVSISL